MTTKYDHSKLWLFVYWWSSFLLSKIVEKKWYRRFRVQKLVLVCWKMKMYTLIKNNFTSIFFFLADYDNLFHHLNSVQGNVELKCAFVRDVIREAGRFKKKVLIQMLEQFQTSLMQVEGRKRNSLPMETRWYWINCSRDD